MAGGFIRSICKLNWHILSALTVFRTRLVFTYDNTEEWKERYPSCDADRQSPIDIIHSNAQVVNFKPIQYKNYDVPLLEPLNLRNNGHTVEIDITKTQNGQPPTITGGPLHVEYRAANIHFHWGSHNKLGSEHTIEGEKYDAEMHIVHKRVNPDLKDFDEFTVISILLEATPDRRAVAEKGLKQITDALPSVSNPGEQVKLGSNFILSDIIEQANADEYYTYTGRTTTPPCSGKVTWIVFTKPLKISCQMLTRLWALKDEHGRLLLDNNRPVQNNRQQKLKFCPKIVDKKKKR